MLSHSLFFHPELLKKHLLKIDLLQNVTKNFKVWFKNRRAKWRKRERNQMNEMRQGFGFGTMPYDPSIYGTEPYGAYSATNWSKMSSSLTGTGLATNTPSLSFPWSLGTPVAPSSMNHMTLGNSKHSLGFPASSTMATTALPSANLPQSGMNLGSLGSVASTPTTSYPSPSPYAALTGYR